MDETATELQFLREQVESLLKENEELKQKLINDPFTLKVTQKRGVALYGLGRFPIIMYADDWIVV